MKHSIKEADLFLLELLLLNPLLQKLLRLHLLPYWLADTSCCRQGCFCSNYLLR